MSDAYSQVELDDATDKLSVDNTHKGLFRYNRLSFRPTPAPAIFQKLVDNLVSCIPYVAAYLDDVTVTGRTKGKHLQNLKQVFSALNEYGMKLRSFDNRSHTWDTWSSETIRRTSQCKIPTLENVNQMERFTSKLNYYRKFLPSLSTICAPLNRLRRQDVELYWSRVRPGIHPTEGHARPEDTLGSLRSNNANTLAADASSYDIGAVISQCAPDGTEEPTAFAS